MNKTDPKSWPSLKLCPSEGAGQQIQEVNVLQVVGLKCRAENVKAVKGSRSYRGDAGNSPLSKRGGLHIKPQTRYVKLMACASGLG